MTGNEATVDRITRSDVAVAASVTGPAVVAGARGISS
jgi:hypothetical protein